ncbi:hypothetical protein QYF36_003728 [Acer negundo]|nr:hypothetical protein QYF36_003728 [Acer negundo]
MGFQPLAAFKVNDAFCIPDSSCESVVMSGQHQQQQQNPTQHSQRDANNLAGGVAARACGLVSNFWTLRYSTSLEDDNLVLTHDLHILILLIYLLIGGLED